MRKYLTDLGIKLENVPQYWNPDDGRQEAWREEREIYGFDERDTWSLDYTMRILLYERLKMFLECDDCDRSKELYEDLNGTKYSMNEIIEKIIKGLELGFIGGEISEESRTLIEEVWFWYYVIEKRLWW